MMLGRIKMKKEMEQTSDSGGRLKRSEGREKVGKATIGEGKKTQGRKRWRTKGKKKEED